MKKTTSIKLFYYTADPNLGDLLNELICEKIFKIPIQQETNIYKCDSIFIGSLLQCFIKERKSLHHKIKYNLTSLMFKPVIIWGGGFLKEGDDCITKRKLDIRALRGEKTKQRLEKLLKIKLNNIVLGDPGILAYFIIDKKVQKKYKIGIIPHYADLNKSIFKELNNFIPNSILINPQENCLENLYKIYQCEAIISSALHGLIIADGMNIPNIRLIASDLIANTQFKFEDYYSAYGLNKHNFLDIREKTAQEVLNMLTNNQQNDILTTITNKQSVPFEKVKIAQSKLLKSFPYNQ